MRSESSSLEAVLRFLAESMTQMPFERLVYPRDYSLGMFGMIGEGHHLVLNTSSMFHEYKSILGVCRCQFPARTVVY